MVVYSICQVEQRGLTIGQRDQAIHGFYRVHCFKYYGGEDWMKILLALGHCNEEVINQANRVLTRRIDEKAGRVAATHTQAGPILSKRTRQMMQGVSPLDLEPVHPPNTGSGNVAKRAREHAKNLSKLKG